MFIHQVRNFFMMAREYVSKNADSLIMNFIGELQGIVDQVQRVVEDFYVQMPSAGETAVQALADYSMIPASEAQQYSPIIYENYLSLQSYGQFRFTDANGKLPDPPVPPQLSFLPIYMTHNTRSQIYVSESSMSLALKALQIKHLSKGKVRRDTLGGVPCNTDALSVYLVGFNATFGPKKQCEYAVGLIESEVNNILQFQAGDIFLETLSVEVDINF